MALMWNRTVDWDADDWRRAAACRNTEPDLFFPVGTTGPAIDQIDAAKGVCRSCEALEPCLDFHRADPPLGLTVGPDRDRYLHTGAPAF
jgi:WhiB family redox-sensing transcriptional regulator